MEGELGDLIEAELAGEAGGRSVCLEESLLKLEVADGRDMRGVGDGRAGGVGFGNLDVILPRGGLGVVDLDGGLWRGLSRILGLG